MNKRLISWLPVLFLATVIFLLSSLSNPPAPGPVFPLKDKVGHWAVYCVLGGLVARALRQGHGLSPAQTFVLTIILTSAYGATDEWHQHFVPHRSCDVLDWLADTLGGGTAAVAYYAYESHRSAKANR